jgi:ornithine decarboxylase
VLPELYRKYEERYKDYTIRQLCQEMHDFYRSKDAKVCQKQLFRADYFPERAITPWEADNELTRNNAKLVKLDDILGEIALEGALPYPPGIFCVVPGERWNEVAQKYFLILEELINKFPGFAPEIQGVYLEKENGSIKGYGYVLDRNKYQ